ncbi:unnamed protein product [Amoebophrya sp. A25]|nr:unnamed protein product [Amoebophrya sp. A25]|eukprot:GSA25T00010803001.1
MLAPSGVLRYPTELAEEARRDPPPWRAACGQPYRPRKGGQAGPLWRGPPQIHPQGGGLPPWYIYKYICEYYSPRPWNLLTRCHLVDAPSATGSTMSIVCGAVLFSSNLYSHTRRDLLGLERA